MATEAAAALVEKRRDDRVASVGKIIRKKRFIRRTKQPPRVVPMTLQRLFVSCREVFRGPGTVPSSEDVQKLCHILDDMMPEDVGLSMDQPFFNPKSVVKGTPRVTCTTIYQCEKFSMCLFFLPATAVIPLHNHPEMTVFSKLLLGNMHIKAYDWVDPVNSDNSEPPSSQLRLARLKANRVFTAGCNTSVLYPTSGGNIHAFTAITPCAVLDVLGPPYSKEDGRDGSYYKDTPYTALSNIETTTTITTTVAKEEGDCYGWLEEIEMPKDAEMEGVKYLGPQIIETRS